MFREIKEIKKEEDNKKALGYLQIKPKENLSDDEINNIVMMMFQQAAAEAARGEV